MIYVYGDKNASKMNFEIFAIRNSCKNAVPKYTLDAYEKAYTPTDRHTDTPTNIVQIIYRTSCASLLAFSALVNPFLVGFDCSLEN